VAGFWAFDNREVVMQQQSASIEASGGALQPLAVPDASEPESP
jgi:hypothetical protein